MDDCKTYKKEAYGSVKGYWTGRLRALISLTHPKKIEAVFQNMFALMIGRN
jgi:hypothetical protein